MKDKSKIKIQFPNLLLIPIFSIVGSIVRAFGMTHYDWIQVVIFMPILAYFMWCIGYVAIAILSILICKILERK